MGFCLNPSTDTREQDVSEHGRLTEWKNETTEQLKRRDDQTEMKQRVLFPQGEILNQPKIKAGDDMSRNMTLSNLPSAN